MQLNVDSVHYFIHHWGQTAGSWHNKEHSETQEFQELLSTFNLVQQVNFVTHNGGNTLDYIISREDDRLVTSVSQGNMIADHRTVLATSKSLNPTTARKNMSLRKFKSIDSEKFGQDLSRHYQISPYPMMFPMPLVFSVKL